MLETLLSEVGPNFGHITQKIVLNLLLPICLIENFSIECFWDMALIGFLIVFLVCASFPDALYDLAMEFRDNTTSFPRTLDTMVFLSLS